MKKSKPILPESKRFSAIKNARFRFLGLFVLLALAATTVFSTSAAAKSLSQFLFGVESAGSSALTASSLITKTKSFFGAQTTALVVPNGGDDNVAMVTTDKTDYNPGETVVITGSGFTIFEPIRLEIFREGVQTTTYLVNADESGNFINREFIIGPDDLGVAFSVKATGGTSAKTAESKFTDGKMQYSPVTKSYTGGANAVKVNGVDAVTVTFPQDITSPATAPFNFDVTLSGPDVTKPTVFGNNATFDSKPTTPFPMNFAVAAQPNKLTFEKKSETKSWNISVTVPGNTPTGVYSGVVVGHPSNNGHLADVGTQIIIEVKNETPNDTTAPSTIPTSIVPSGYASTGYTNQNVSVTLTATDNAGGVGVRSLSYIKETATTTSSETIFGSSASINVNEEGKTTIRYSAVDNNGNQEGPQNVFVVNIDRTKPVITLNGDANVEIPYGGTFTDGGFSITDRYYAGGPTRTINALPADVVTGAVNTNLVGVYTLRYNNKDEARNSADEVIRTVRVIKADQAINFAFGTPTSKTFGDPDFNVSATGGNSGNAVTFAAKTGSSCTVTGNNNGTARVSNLAAGNCVVVASQAGNDNYNPAPAAEHRIAIGRASGSVSINNIPDNALFGGSFTPAFTKTGDGAASVVSESTAICTVNGNGAVSFIKAGQCSLKASVAEGTNHSAAAGATQSFTIGKANQAALAITSPTAGTFGELYTMTANGGSTEGAVSFNVVSGSTGCAINQNKLEITNGSGICSITATMAGNDNYNEVTSAAAQVAISKAGATLSLSNLTHTYDGSAKTVAVTTMPTGLTGVSVTYSRNNAGVSSPTNAGSYNVVATLNNANYELPQNSNGVRQVTATLKIDKANQTISWSNPAAIVYGTPLGSTQLNATVTGVATGSELGTLTYSPAAGEVLNAGERQTLRVDAAQTANYNAAFTTVTIDVSKKSVTITAANGQSKVYGEADPVLTYTASENVPFTGNLNRTAGNDAGEYAINLGTLSAGNNYELTLAESPVFTIGKRDITVSANANQAKTYGDPDPAAFAYSVTAGSLVTGDSFSGKLARVGGENVGNYAITQGDLALSANYKLVFAGKDFTVTARSVRVKAANVTRTHGYSAPAFSLVLAEGTLGNGDTLASLGAPQYGSEGTAVGAHRINVGGLGNNNYSIGYATGDARGLLTVVSRQTRITLLTAPAEGVFSSCLTVSAKLEDIGDGSAATAINGGSVKLRIGNSENTFVTDGNGVASGLISVLGDIGAATISASFAGDSTRAANATSRAFLIKPSFVVPLSGNASVYTGETMFWTTSQTSSTATLTLSAALQDRTGHCVGDVRNARVTFAIRNADGSTTPINGASNLPVGLVNAADPTVGTASATVQYNLGNANAETLNIAVIVGGYYQMQDARLSEKVITISKPTPGLISAGGDILNTASNGLLAGVNDGTIQTSFGFNVKYNKSGSNPQGSVSFIVQSRNLPDGTPDPTGRIHRYLIKSNAISTMSVNLANYTATFSSKANIQEITDSGIVSISGGAIIQLSMSDRCRTGSCSAADTIGVTVQNSNGGVWFSSNWSPATLRTTEKETVKQNSLTVQ